MRHIIHLLAARLAYWIGLDALMYYFNRGAKRIITFHNVLGNDIIKSNPANFVSNTEEDFRTIIQELAARFRFSVDVFDASTITITFDDGFVNQCEVAGRILAEEGNIPAIIFAAGQNIENKDPLSATVVDLLAVWVSYAPDGDYEIEGKRFCLSKETRGMVWHSIVYPMFADDAKWRGKTVLGMLDQLYPLIKVLEGLPEEYVRLRLTGISTGQISELRQKGWLIGYHTKSHFPLSKLTLDEQIEEMRPNDSQMLRTVFSYPYGNVESVNGDSIKACKSVGYPCAVSNMSDPYFIRGKYFLPRFTLSADKYELHFELSGLKYLLIKHKLLPTL